ncbi:Spy/CpxP family protein refolding chaperone [Paraglaciecola polaris]|uniref:LTXXQ motif family protein n=1 Tax=Paraglaciecola polaris LMG 21857 TaxID=1129793 RepID=K6ZQI2_9ALTE|nr:Spy/CpxP family protein refolding chaperone [Paraglaciecola polaris]GAC32542.1 hypothetical protein GPLA_1628 [Paraglaciecola polaris LMG 21857]|tara:strand:- start:1060 stop:1839 length:780 start_codon:yes stop_codon:yes gene_type:complete
MLTLKLISKPIALSLALLAIQASVTAHPRLHNDAINMHSVLKNLDLTTTQRQDIRLLRQQQHADNATLMQDMRVSREAVRLLIQSNIWNENEIRTALKQEQELASQLLWQYIQGQHKIWLTLDDTQKQTFVQTLTDKSQFERPSGPKGKRDDRFDALGLTEKQRVVLANQNQEERSDREQNKTRHLVFEKRILALITNEDLAQSDWLALQQETFEDKLENGLNRAKKKYEFWQLLTPEQQAKMQAKTKQKAHDHHGRNK